MKIKKLLLSIVVALMPVTLGSAAVLTIDKLNDVDIGFVEYGKDFVGEFVYSASSNGEFNMVVTLNSSSKTSPTVVITNKTQQNVGFPSITFDKSLILLNNNKLTVTVYNLLKAKPTVLTRSVTFNAATSLYREVYENEKVNRSACYLSIQNGLLFASDFSYSIFKNPNVINCESNKVNISNNYLTYEGSKDIFSSSIAELRIRNHHECFKVGSVVYDSSKKSYYNKFNLRISSTYKNKVNTLSFITDLYCVSLHNLFMRNQGFYKDDGTNFLSRDFYIPIGFNSNSLPYIFEILLSNVGPLKDSFLLSSSYYPKEEHFGSCYSSSYCVYSGDAR